MTQELMANMVGGRRESVTVTAGRLQELGALRYSRGHISIINRPLLEELACECYEVVKKRIAQPREPRNLSSSVVLRNARQQTAAPRRPLESEV